MANRATATATEWMKRTQYVLRNLLRRGSLRIGTRLTACFVAIALAMIAVDVVAVWQFSRITASGQRLNQADQTSLAVLRVHLDVYTFRGHLAALTSGDDARQFASEAAALRKQFQEDVAHAEQVLRSSPGIARDPPLLSALETVKWMLPRQLDRVLGLAAANENDWQAARLRLLHQVRSLIDYSALLVQRVDRFVSQERAEGIEQAKQARRQLFLVLSVTALLTLLMAVVLGWYVTRSITDPLAELDAGAQALARGEFQHRVDVGGEDELTTLGKAFNHAARQLGELYDTVRQSEKELQDVIETIPAMAWITLPDGSNIFTNRHWLEYTGLSAEDTVSSGWQAVVHPEDRDRYVDKRRAALASGEPFEYEARFRRAADGKYRWFLVRGVPLRDERGHILKWYGISTDIDDRKRAEALLAGEKRILEMVARGASLAQILDSLCRLVEEQAPDVLASVLLVEGNRLQHGGAPSLPKTYTDAIDGMVIGPRAGSCGTAAYRAEQVMVSDIATDPLWADYREAALSHALRTCWSTPTFSSEGKVIATFALYYREQRSPSQRDQEMIEQMSHLAGVAIQRKLAEDELWASEARYRTFVDHATDAFFLQDEQGTILDVNRQACESLGYSREELIGMTPRAFDLDVNQALIDRISEQLAGGAIVTFESRHRRKDGTAFPVEIRARQFRQGGRRFGVSLVRDITERKRAEQRRAAQHAVTQILAEAATLEDATPKILQAVCEGLAWDVGALWRLDREAGVLRCVEVWHKASVAVPEFEATSRESTFAPGVGLLGRVWLGREPAYIPDLVRDPNFQRAPSAAREGLHAAFGFPILLGGDVLGVIECFSREIRPPDPDLLTVMATVGSQIGQFIERKWAEDALHHAQAELAHVTRVMTVGELAASIAHEVNQPLAGVTTNGNAGLRWLARHPPDLAEARACLQRIIRDGQRAGDVIARIRSFVRKAAPQKVRLAIHDVIAEVIALADGELRRHGVLLTTDLAAHLPPVLADRIQLQQVLLNLLLNGMEAMRGVTERPRALIVRAQPEGDAAIRVAVDDAGVGIAPQDLERMFTAFFTTKPEGMGMGLAISRSIIEAHGGKLWATTNVGSGVTVHFTLPTGEAGAS